MPLLRFTPLSFLRRIFPPTQITPPPPPPVMCTYHEVGNDAMDLGILVTQVLARPWGCPLVALAEVVKVFHRLGGDRPEQSIHDATERFSV